MRQGFTLIEVMVAAAVLAVGCLGVLGMLMTSINHNREARDSSAAVTIAEQALYDLEIQATDWETNKNITTSTLGKVYQASSKTPGQWQLLKVCNINGVPTGKPAHDRFAVGYYMLKPMSKTSSNDHIRGAIRVVWNNTKSSVNCLDASVFAKMDKFPTAQRSCGSISIPFALGPNIVH